MFTRLFRRQSQSTSNTTQPHKERGNTQHSHSNASNGKGDASSTHITKDAGPNNENKKLDESIRKALRILICQDTGDKKKLVLYDSAFDVDINTQAAPSQGQGRDVPGAANGSHSTGVNIKIPRRHDDHSMSGSMGGSWRGTWVGSWSSFRSIRDSGSTTVREKGMRDQREKDSMRRLSGVSSVGGRGDDGRDWRSGRGFIGGRRKSLKNLDLIGEMMFGAVPLTPKGITTKIHYFRAPHLQILITKVFTLPTDIDEQEEEEMLSHLLAHARTGSLSSSYESDESWSPVGSVEGGDGSWRSGWGRHSGALKKPRRRVSYSVALLIDCSSTPLLRDFVFTHYILLERHLLRLQKKVLLIIMESLRSDHTPSSSSSSIPCSESHARYHDFPRRPPSTSSTSTSSISVSDRDTLSFPWFSTAYALQSDTDLMEVVHRVQDNISILYEAPRMEEPIWLDMECFPQRSGDVAERFVKMFKEMIEELNAVGKSGFLITFITALLMHHTGWTQTLLPSTAFSPTSPTSSPSTSNPYITQINQLYGNTTSPPRTARTLVIGNKTFAQKLLSIATYFVRCTELVEGVQQAVPHGDNEGTVGGDEQAQEVELGGYVEIALPGTQVVHTIPSASDPLPPIPLHRFTYSRSLLGGYNHTHSTTDRSRLPPPTAADHNPMPTLYSPDFAIMALPMLPPMSVLTDDLAFDSELSGGTATVVVVDCEGYAVRLIRRRVASPGAVRSEWGSGVSGSGGGSSAGRLRPRNAETFVVPFGGDHSESDKGGGQSVKQGVERMVEGVTALLECGFGAADVVEYLEMGLRDILAGMMRRGEVRVSG